MEDVEYLYQNNKQKRLALEGRVGEGEKQAAWSETDRIVHNRIIFQRKHGCSRRWYNGPNPQNMRASGRLDRPTPFPTFHITARG